MLDGRGFDKSIFRAVNLLVIADNMRHCCEAELPVNKLLAPEMEQLGL